MANLTARYSALARAVRPVLAIVLIAAVVALVVMGMRIQSGLAELRGVANDNLHWNLAQIEVDLVRLNEEVRVNSPTPDASMAELRKRFDLFYSRAQNIIGGKGFEKSGLDSLVPAMALLLQDFLDQTTPLIDGTDETLRNSLPAISMQIAALREELRQQSITMISRIAALGDERRAAFALLVREVALAGMALVTILAIFLGLVIWLNRAAAREAKQTATISERLTATVDSALDAILVTDAKGRVIQFNPSAESIFGYRRGEIIGRDFSELIIPAKMRDAHRAGLKRVEAGGAFKMVGSGRIQTDACDSTGRQFPVELSISAAEGDHGRIYIAFLRDITERIASETALKTARDEALAAERTKTAFLAVMSHEMRTPLNGVLASLEIAERKGADPEQMRFISLAKDSANQLLRHANDVLDISRMEAGGMSLALEDFDLAQSISALVESVRPLCVEKDISLDFTMLSESAVLRGDPFRFGQIVQNFLSNAIKFVTKGGITVEAELTDVDGGMPEVEVRVIDTGFGIAQEDQERIFDDFVMLDPSFRRSGGGAGLGLAIARRLARAMGGEVGVESTPGDGSCFWVRLRLPLAKSDAASAKAADAHRALPRKDILVVEDNATNRAVLEEMLRFLGQNVVLAHDGASGAAEAVARHYDAILMDISMPVMDGLAATQLIRSGGASMNSRIIAVTAHSMPADLQRFKAAGMDDVLVKPLSNAGLVRILSESGDHVETHSDNLIDSERIDELRTVLGTAGLAKLAETFRRDVAALVERAIAASGNKASKEELARICHEAAGVAAVFGAGQMHELFSDCEVKAQEGQVEAARSIVLADARRLWRDTDSALSAVI